MDRKKEQDRCKGRIKVLLLLPELGIGGAETHVMHLLERLDRSRFSVSLCCLKHGAADWEERAGELAENYFVLGFRGRKLPIMIARLTRILLKERYDILHCHLPLADTIGRVAAVLARVPVVVTTEHGKHLWKSKAHLFLDRLLMPATDLRICVSRDIVEIRKRLERTPENKLAYIPNAVDISAVRKANRTRREIMAEFGWRGDNRLLLAVGRIVPAKNYGALIEAVSILRDRFPDLRCIVAGEGSAEGEIRAAMESFRLGDILVLAGSRRDIPDLLAASDIFVLASIREGLPVSLLEAMAAGKAIVATAVGGVPDAITNGETGLLVEPDPRALADAISHLLENDSLRRSLGEAAARVAEERFSVESMVRRVGEVYSELYERSKGRHE